MPRDRQEVSGFLFSSQFLDDHAGHIISDPRIAVVELIANSYDAGATGVTLTWPDDDQVPVSVEDNGTGMTAEDFLKRWKTFCYNRVQEQGPNVEFPRDQKRRTRRAFGRTGKGRYAGFCFADSYQVVSWKDGTCFTSRVSRTPDNRAPFDCALGEVTEKEGHGTRIVIDPIRNILPVADVRELIGSKFLVDPDVAITVNGRRVQLFDLQATETSILSVANFGEVIVHQIDSGMLDRVVRLRGITWWVNTRMVGEPSWGNLDGEGAYLDGRTLEARRYTFVVKADILHDNIKPDWSGFYATAKFNSVKDVVDKHIVETLGRLLAGTRKTEKKAAIRRHRELLNGLPPVSRKEVGRFVDQVLENCPTITQRDLSRTAEIFAKMEQSRSGFDLLKRLAACSPDDLDTWNDLMQEFSASNAQIILTELQKRLTLIERLQELVNSDKADELHDIQPLFERGLWIFGPEYEAVDFRSNRSLAESIRTLLGGTQEHVPTERPDFVALPDTSIGVYSSDEFDETGEISGIRKILVVELKRGGFALRQEHMDEARDRAQHLRNARRVGRQTQIVVYLLGASFADDLQVVRIGDKDETIVKPTLYDVILRTAHARTFNLQSRLEETGARCVPDSEIEEVLSEPVQSALFVDKQDPDVE